MEKKRIFWRSRCVNYLDLDQFWTQDYPQIIKNLIESEEIFESIQTFKLWGDKVFCQK